MPAVLVATWTNGVFAVSGGAPQQELAHRSVRALAPDEHGGAFAIVDNHSVCRRASNGTWSLVATADVHLSCCALVGDLIYAGTDDASLLRISANGEIEQLESFQNVPGREHWFAGGAMINGKFMGPPLGVRSMTAASDGKVLLANVHVGGIPRSVDNGATWQPTIDIKSDVHEVRAHPTRPEIVAAAAAVGLCISRDAGSTWEVEQRGLHAPHCSAVAFAGDDVLVSASVDPFTPQGALYRRGVDGPGPLVRVSGGLPDWLEGKVDTGCIAARGKAVAAADWNGNLYVTTDHGRNWSCRAIGLRNPSNVLIV